MDHKETLFKAVPAGGIFRYKAGNDYFRKISSSETIDKNGKREVIPGFYRRLHVDYFPDWEKGGQ